MPTIRDALHELRHIRQHQEVHDAWLEYLAYLIDHLPGTGAPMGNPAELEALRTRLAATRQAISAAIVAASPPPTQE